MRAPIKLLGLAAAASLAFGASVAHADFVVRGDTQKFKTISVNKSVFVTKSVSVFSQANVLTDSASEQDIVANQRNQFNFVEDENGQSTNSITGSFVGASGEQAVIQNNGYNNNNENADSLSFANSPFGLDLDGAGVFANAEIDLEQINGAEFLDAAQTSQVNGETPAFVNTFAILSGITYANDITDSFTGAAGVAKVIQENGSNNNNFNGVAIALGDFAVLALDEVNSGQTSNFNFANVNNGVRTNTIAGSFGTYSGIISVIQNNGANSNNANLSAVAASISGAPSPGTPPTGAGVSGF